MFKHLTKLFDFRDFPALIDEYDRLRVEGRTAEAERLSLQIPKHLMYPEEARR